MFWYLARKRERHWCKCTKGGWQKEREGSRQTDRQTDRQVDWQTEKADNLTFWIIILYFPSPSTWHITGEKVTFTLQLHVSTCLTIVPTQKLLLFNMTSPRKRNIKDSKLNHFIRWEPLSLKRKKHFMTSGSIWTIDCEMSMWNVKTYMSVR